MFGIPYQYTESRILKVIEKADMSLYWFGCVSDMLRGKNRHVWNISATTIISVKMIS